MSLADTREVYRVGELVLDVDAHLLTRAGEMVPLPPKTFELLVLLVRRTPGMVRRCEIMDAVWPQETVNDEALTQRVMLLRRALGDDPKHPRYVASALRWGYRLVAPVERVAPAAPRPEPPPLPAAGTEGSSCVVIFGDRQVPLPEGESILGRDPAATLHVDSPDVSRRHARIVVWPGRAVLEDLGSKNGTYLWGQRIAGPAELTDGDTIGVGPVLLTFRVVGLAGSTLTRPAAPARSE